MNACGILDESNHAANDADGEDEDGDCDGFLLPTARLLSMTHKDP